MNLLVIRHAIAEDKDQFAKTGKNDDLRPLTAEGREKMARGVRGLRAAAPEISLLASSPLVRAVQTAEIVGKEYRVTIGDTTDVLRPDATFNDFVSWLGGHTDRSVVAVVGHEPHLSALVTWLMSGNDDARIDLKKGAACMLSFDGRVTGGRGLLCWALTPKQMRKLGNGD
jgi:phosphohistidine phosphatase